MDTSNIESWPEDVFMGFAEISEDGKLDILSSKEREEYYGFKNPKRKAEFLSARYLFHALLNEMNLTHNEIEILKESTGKPYAIYNGETIHVSFSHSPEKVFCAISHRFNIGLDVEHTNRTINKAVVKRILNENEWNVVGEEDPIKLWTIKEAAVKCLGTGLRTNLKDLTIVKKGKKRFSVRFNNENMFEICNFKQSDHQIALAYQSKQI
ncbi:MAG: 4'-phosphopantetheinyl transferase superfamily protein [Balneolaceae bacterium]